MRGELGQATESPDVMRPGELMRRLGLKHSRFGLLQQLGRFRHLESPMARVLGVPHLYSRKKVAAAIDGQSFPALQKRA